MQPSPEKGYLNGLVFPRLEHLELGEEAPLEDLKTATPALKSLKIATGSAEISNFVAHMGEQWPEMLEHLEVTVWGPNQSVTSNHPAVRGLVGLAREKKLLSFDLVVGRGEES
ncbi:hypothetical protein FRC01_013836, partial [Tulasnella sp. 417]